MPSVNIQENPVVAKVGTRNAEATIINSDVSAAGNVVYYQVEDRENNDIINVNTLDDIGDADAKVVSVSATSLKVILRERRKHRVRVRVGSNDWGSWVNFKTRDKRYQSPDATAKLSDDTDDTSTQKGARRIIVTNSAKATVTLTNAGATVVNSDKFYADTESISSTSRGATIVNDNTVQYTSRGATINTN